MKVCNANMCIECDELYLDSLSSCPSCGEKRFMKVSQFIIPMVDRKALTNKRGETLIDSCKKNWKEF